MIEYLYDAIRATAGTDIVIAARVTQDDGTAITEGCELVIHKNDNTMVSIDGDYQEDTWFFAIPADVTKGMNGRYMYCIKHYDEQLCFMQPIYFI